MGVKEGLKTGIKFGVQAADLLFPELPRQQNIFKYYSIPNEIEFARNSGLSAEDKKFYIEENVHRFLGEFAGQVPYTSLSYVLEDGAFTYRGIDLTRSYERTAQNSEREHSEYIGYSRIQDAFSKGANSAVWVSPPKDADYGFVFYFSRDKENPDVVREHILRYDEPREDDSLSKSKAILKKIHPSGNVSGLNSALDFLTHPLIGGSEPTPYADLRLIMSALGIDKNGVDASVRFEKRMRSELVNWLELYTEAVLSGDTYSAGKLLLASYNYAFDARRNILQFSADMDHRPPLTEANFNYYASQKRAVITGSCPVSQNDFNDPFSPTSIIDKLLSGKTINGMASEAQNFVCPNCEHKADGPVGNQCPGCRITREEWAEKGNRVC